MNFILMNLLELMINIGMNHLGMAAASPLFQNIQTLEASIKLLPLAKAPKKVKVKIHIK